MSLALPLLMPLPPSLRALLRTTPTIAPVPHRAVISITGSQSSEFLQGILSTSVTHPPKGPFYSSFLHAQAGCPRPLDLLVSA